MTSASFSLDIVGEIPEGIETGPLMRVATVLTDQQEALNLPLGRVNVAFVTDDVIATMNRQYSGNDYATDVLSFNYLETGEAIDGVVGEIVIAYEIAATQARDAGTTTDAEIALLGLHGVLHIAGHDHQDQQSQQELSGIQAKLMQAAGVQYREFAWQE